MILKNNIYSCTVTNNNNPNIVNYPTNSNIISNTNPNYPGINAYNFTNNPYSNYSLGNPYVLNSTLIPNITCINQLLCSLNNFIGNINFNDLYYNKSQTYNKLETDNIFEFSTDILYTNSNCVYYKDESYSSVEIDNFLNIITNNISNKTENYTKKEINLLINKIINFVNNKNYNDLYLSKTKVKTNLKYTVTNITPIGLFPKDSSMILASNNIGDIISTNISASDLYNMVYSTTTSVTSASVTAAITAAIAAAAPNYASATSVTSLTSSVAALSSSSVTSASVNTAITSAIAAAAPSYASASSVASLTSSVAALSSAASSSSSLYSPNPNNITGYFTPLLDYYISLNSDGTFSRRGLLKNTTIQTNFVYGTMSNAYSHGTPPSTIYTSYTDIKSLQNAHSSPLSTAISNYVYTDPNTNVSWYNTNFDYNNNKTGGSNVPNNIHSNIIISNFNTTNYKNTGFTFIYYITNFDPNNTRGISLFNLFSDNQIGQEIIKSYQLILPVQGLSGAPIEYHLSASLTTYGGDGNIEDLVDKSTAPSSTAPRYNTSNNSFYYQDTSTYIPNSAPTRRLACCCNIYS